MANYATVLQLRGLKVSGEQVDLSAYSDAELLENLTIAESIIEGYTGTIFYKMENESRYFNGAGTQNIYLAQVLNYPIISASTCTEVDENDTVLFTYDEGPDFVVKPWYLAKTWSDFSARLAIGTSGPTWPRGYRNIKVTGDWGREDVPTEVTRATLLLAVEMSKAGSSGLASNQIARQEWDDYKVQYKGSTGTALDPTTTTGFDFVDRILDKWRFRPDMFLTPEVHLP